MAVQEPSKAGSAGMEAILLARMRHTHWIYLTLLAAACSADIDAPEAPAPAPHRPPHNLTS